MYSKIGNFKVNSVRIAETFLAFGITILALSFSFTSQILAFIGLGLTFWGALFILVTPQKHVDSSLLEITIIPEYLTIDRMLNDLKPKGKAYWIPPYPKNVTMPEHLKGLKEMVIFIQLDEVSQMVSIEEIAKGKFQIENPKGILLAPPGLGIIDRIEQKQNAPLGLDIINRIVQKQDTNLTQIAFHDLIETLPQLLGDLNLFKEMKITVNNDDIIIQITGSIYKNVYGQKYNLKSIHLLGCPLVNAVACAISKSTGKIVTMQKLETSPEGQTTTVILKGVQL